MSRMITGGRGAGQAVQGEAIVLPRTFTFFGGVDWASGQLTLGDTALDQWSIKDRILVFRSPAGGQGTAWKIGEMAKRGTGPRGIVVFQSNSVLVSGCVLARVPLLADLPEDPTGLICTGQTVAIDPRRGVVEILG